MPDYKKMYHIMFNAATDAERKLEDALVALKAAQIECEEMYLQNGAQIPCLPYHSDKQAVLKLQLLNER